MKIAQRIASVKVGLLHIDSWFREAAPVGSRNMPLDNSSTRLGSREVSPNEPQV